MKVFEITDETKIPEELLIAVKGYGEGKYKIQTKTCIGWVDVESPDFIRDCKYKIVEA